MIKLVCIAAGGAAGSVLRYLLGGWTTRLWESWFPATYFPAGTLLINVTGCLAIGVLSALLSGPLLIREEYRLGLTIGVLGGFTTFSTFGLESFYLLSDGQRLAAAVNVVLSCVLGILAVVVGYRLAERFFGV